MAIKPVQRPNLPDYAGNLFGGADPFTPRQQPEPASNNLFKLPEIPSVQTSPAAQQAIADMQRAAQQAEQGAAQARQVAAQQQKLIDDINADTQKALQATAKMQEERAKAEEKAKKEAAEKVKEDNTLLVKEDIATLLGRSDYKNAGDLQKRAIASEYRKVVEQKLRSGGLDDETVAKSLQAYDRQTNADITRYVDENTNKGVWGTIKGTAGDLANSIGKAVASYRQSDATEEAGQITDAHMVLRNGGTARGWHVEEMLSRDPSIRKYLKKEKNGLIDSLSSFSLRKDLTASERAAFEKKAQAVYTSADKDITARIADVRRHEEGLSREQQREMKNHQYEAMLLEQEHNAKGSWGITRAIDNFVLAMKYPATMATEQAGNAALTVGTGIAAAAATTAAVGTLGTATPAAAASWANFANNARKLIAPLTTGAMGAELTETDIVNTVRHEVLNADINVLRKNPDWQQMLDLSGGNEELARQRLATRVADDDTLKAKTMSFFLNVIGPEALLASAISRRTLGQAVAQGQVRNIGLRETGKSVGLATVSTLSEGVEEGFTQYVSNYTLQGMGLKDNLMDGVWEAAGMGMAVGGMMTAPATTLNTVGNVRAERQAQAQGAVVADFRPENIQAKTDNYVQQGAVDFGAFRSQVVQDYVSFNHNLAAAFPKSPEQIKNLNQRYFDMYIDNEAVMATLTPAQQKSIKDTLRTSFDVNTNPYRTAQRTQSMQAVLLGTSAPTDGTLADVWRAVHNVDLQNIQNVRVAEALAEIVQGLDNGHGVETTRARLTRGMELLNSITATTPNLTEADITEINRVMYQHFDANLDREGMNGTQANEPSQVGTGTNTQTADTGAEPSGQTVPNTEEDTTNAGQRTVDNESVGDSGTQQTPAQDDTTGTTTTTGADPVADVGGAEQAQGAEPNTNATTTVGSTGGTTATEGTTRPADQGGQSFGPADTQATPTAESDGGTRTQTAERYSDDERSGVTAEEVSSVIDDAIIAFLNTQGTAQQYDAIEAVAANVSLSVEDFMLQEWHNPYINEFITDTIEQDADLEASADTFAPLAQQAFAEITYIAETMALDARSRADTTQETTQEEIPNANDTQNTDEEPVDSEQPTTGQAQDENSADGVGDVRDTDEQSGDVRTQSPTNDGEVQETPDVISPQADTRSTTETLLRELVADGTLTQRHVDELRNGVLLDSTGNQPEYMVDADGNQVPFSLDAYGAVQEAIDKFAKNLPVYSSSLPTAWDGVFTGSFVIASNGDLYIPVPNSREQAIHIPRYKKRPKDATSDFKQASAKMVSVPSEAFDFDAWVQRRVELERAIQDRLATSTETVISNYAPYGNVLRVMNENLGIENPLITVYRPVLNQDRTVLLSMMLSPQGLAFREKTDTVWRHVVREIVSPSEESTKGYSLKTGDVATGVVVVNGSRLTRLDDRLAELGAERALETAAITPTDISGSSFDHEGLVTLLHEYGHFIESNILGSATPEEITAIKQDYNRWRAENRNHALKHVELAQRGALEMLGTTIGDLESLSTAREGNWSLTSSREYILSKSEWWADNVKKHLMSDSNPQSVIDQFFNRVAAIWRVILDRLAGRESSLAEMTAPSPAVVAVLERRWAEDRTYLVADLTRKHLSQQLTERDNQVIVQHLQSTGDSRSVPQFVSESLADQQFENNTSLPARVRQILRKLWNAIKQSFAAVSLATAVATGTVMSIPTAEASPVVSGLSPQASQTVAHIQATQDNGGRPFIIADKRHGTISLMSADGSLLQQAPALFGKQAGDSATGRNTPAGRFETQFVTTSSAGYGGNAQALTVNGQMQTWDGSTLAIHRVLDIENRPARLRSKSASDNRISHGCINVPKNFYDQHLDGEFNGVVYVLPETNSFAGQMFQDGSPAVLPNANAEPRTGSQQAEPSATRERPTTQATPTQSVAPDTQATPTQSVAPTTPSTSVASTTAPSVTAEQITAQATPTTTPRVNGATATIAGTTPSTQTAFVAPVVAESVSVDSVYVPEGQTTPAEERADATFDTEPTQEVSEESGFSIAEIAIGIASALGLGGTTYVARNRLRNRRNRTDNTDTTQGVADDNTDSASSTDDNSSTDTARGSNTEPIRGAFATETELARAIRHELSRHTDQENVTQADFLRFMLDTQGDEFAEFLNGFSFIQSGIDAVLSDQSVAQMQAPFAKHWFWDRNRTVDGSERAKKWGGVGQFYARHVAGISPRFDDFMNNLQDGAGNYLVPRVGMAQDSSKLSVSLAKIRASTNGIYGYMETHFLRPTTEHMTEMTLKYADVGRGKRDGDLGYNVAKDMGDYANIRHTLNEGYRHHFASFDGRIRVFTDHADRNVAEILRMLGIPRGDTDAVELFTYGREEDALSVINTIEETKLRKQAINLYKDSLLSRRNAEREAKRKQTALDVWNGEVDWTDYPSVKMPNGMTKAQAEKARDDLLAVYDRADLDATAELIYKAHLGIRQIGVAKGVFSNEQIQQFNDIGFTEYVPLYKRKDNKKDWLNLERDDEDVTPQSVWEQIFAEYTTEEVKSMGLARDLSRFRRDGMSEPADDAFTNLGVAASNVAGRAGQAEFAQDMQALFENTLRSEQVTAVPSTQHISQLQSEILQRHDSIPGLVRVNADVAKSKLAGNEKIKDVLPIVAKGHILEKDQDGNTIMRETTFHYYFEDTAVQNELTHTIDLNSRLHNNFISNNARTIMRWQARMMTSFRPAWNVWNFAREWYERGATLMFRPVVNTSGERVNRLALALAFNSNLIDLTTDKQAWNDIGRYIMFKEVKTPLQRALRDLHQSGSINLYTDVSERYNLLGEVDKSFLENVAERIGGSATRLSSKSKSVEAMLKNSQELMDAYVAYVVETPQTMNALAMYLAYTDNNVNTREAAHRVRDAFDPIRSQSNFLQAFVSFFPFARSTGAGHYNTWRSFGDAVREFKEDRSVTGLATLGLMVLAGAMLLMAIGSVFGDDDDGEPLLPFLPTDELVRGVPMRLGDSVVFLPVGHGLPSMLWAASVMLYKSLFGSTNAEEIALTAMGQFTKNTAITSLPNSRGFTENAVASTMMMFTPSVLLPFVEVAFNQTLYGGGKIVYQPTPSGRKDSDQDTFHTPDGYKTAAKLLNTVTFGGIDARPENVRHVMNSLIGVGPLRAIDAYMQDKSEKTAGVFSNKGEQFGAVASAIGLDMGVNVSVLGYESQSYRLREVKNEVMAKYDVYPTKLSHEAETEIVELQGVDMTEVKKGTSAERIASEMYHAGASDREIQFVVNTILFENKREKLNKELRELGRSYYNKIDLKDGGQATRDEVREKALELFDEYGLYVKANNNYYREFVAR